MASEKELDKVLEHALANDPAFLTWFVGRTPYGACRPTYRWSRSDHPWCRYDLNAGSGEPRIVEGETDVIAVFDTIGGVRGSVHIENKVAGGRFRPGQPQGYAARAQKWMRRVDFGRYDSYATVVIAPAAFLASEASECAIFDAQISHEEIARLVAAFAG